MAASKGHPKWGGRKKGTPNADSLPLHEKAKELGIDPFAVLLLFAAGDWKKLGYAGEMYIPSESSGDTSSSTSIKFTIDPSVRAKAANEACQYLFPKKKAIEHSGEIGLPEHVIAAASWVASATPEQLAEFVKSKTQTK